MRTVVRTGPTPMQVLDVAQERFSSVLLERVRNAMDMSGEYRKTGYLRQGLTVRFLGRKHELHAPPGRLDNRRTRRGFITLLRDYMDKVR